MQYVAPGADYTSRLSLGPDFTGLVGTLRFRLLDNDSTANDPVYGPSIANIIEDPTGSGDYVFHAGVAPTTQSHYSRAWDTGAGTPLIYDDDLIVTRTATGPFTPSGNEYVTVDELKEILTMQGETFADLAIEIAVETASRAIDGYKRTRFYPSAETRYYSAPLGVLELQIDELVTLTSLTLDMDGDGTYEETWVDGTDFYLDPANASLDDRPTRTIVLRRQAGRHFSRYERGVKVVATFGWATTPTLVKQAAILLANRLLVRTQSAPLGILVAQGNEAVAMARLGRLDGDAAALLDLLPGTQKPGLVTLQAG